MQPSGLQAAAQALGAAQNVQAPTQSPNAMGANAFVQAAIGHLAGLARSNFQLGAGNSGTKIASAQGQIDEANRIAAAKQAAADNQDAIDQLRLKKQTISDPSKYYRQQNKSGGWDFYDPLGNKISAQDYSTIKGIHVTDALKDSQDTKDQEFLQDYQDVVKLGQIMQSGDKKELDKLYQADPTLKKRIGKQTYSDIVKGFRNSYPDYFAGQTQDVGNASYNDKSPSNLGGGGGFFNAIKNFFS